jgi:hypothetical protein
MVGRYIDSWNVAKELSNVMSFWLDAYIWVVFPPFQNNIYILENPWA